MKTAVYPSTGWLVAGLRTAAVMLLAFACERHVATTGPSWAISDGAHLGGNRNFFFLPPLVPDPSGNSDFEPDAFDAAAIPAVEICALAADACAPNQPEEFPVVFTMAGGPGSETIRLDVAAEHFIVNWNAGDFALNPALVYRIAVLVYGARVGYADVDVVSSGRELRNVNTNQYIGLVDGRTLPIKFRIERGAVMAIAIHEVIAVRDQTLVLPSVEIAIAEAIQVADSPRLLAPVAIEVAEAIRVADAGRVMPPVAVNVTELVRVADSPEVLPPVTLALAEMIVVADRARAIPPTHLSVAERLTVTDMAKAIPPAEVTVSERITLADRPGVLPPASISVIESIRVTDAGTVASQQS